MDDVRIRFIFKERMCDAQEESVYKSVVYAVKQRDDKAFIPLPCKSQASNYDVSRFVLFEKDRDI